MNEAGPYKMTLCAREAAAIAAECNLMISGSYRLERVLPIDSREVLLVFTQAAS